MLFLKFEDSDPDLKSLKQLNELIRNERKKDPENDNLKRLYSQWRRTDPEKKLLLIIKHKHYDLLKELASDNETQNLLGALRKQGLRRSRIVTRYKQKIDDWSKAWQQDSNKFGDFVAENCPKNIQTKILVVIDQFEQIITQCDRQEREQFLAWFEGC